jgi:chromate transporter
MAAVTLFLARSAVIDLTTMLLAISSAVVLIRYRVNSAWLVLGGGLIGLAMTLWR